MTLAELLGFSLPFRLALAIGLVVSAIACVVVMPRTIRKLLGAGISGRDRNKPDRPEVAEMGGIGVFIAVNVGVFAILGFGNLSSEGQAVVLASLVVGAGAAMTGILDDLVDLRQRFKAFIPFVFAAPLSLFLPSTTIDLPLVGTVEFSLVYPLLLAPLGVACASNGFNILEGFNGLGTGLGIVLAAALSTIAILHGNLTGLVLLFPLIGALGGFLWFNAYPARVFPGDTGTLFIGAVLAISAMLSKIEFWGFLLFVPHIVEFGLKAAAKFDAQSFATSVDADGVLHYDGKIHSLPHIVMKTWRLRETQIVGILVGAEVVWTILVVAGFIAWGQAG